MRLNLARSKEFPNFTLGILAFELTCLVRVTARCAQSASDRRYLRHSEKFAKGAMRAFTVRLSNLVLMLTRDAIFARHRRNLCNVLEELTSNTRVIFALGQARYIGVLAWAAVFARHWSGLCHLRKELARRTQIILALSLPCLICELTGATILAHHWCCLRNLLKKLAFDTRLVLAK